jgi:hypothetical protein
VAIWKRDEARPGVWEPTGTLSQFMAVRHTREAVREAGGRPRVGVLVVRNGPVNDELDGCRSPIMTTPPKRLIDPLTVTALRLETRAGSGGLGVATGFVVMHLGRPYLITNWQVVAGRNAETGELLSPTGAAPACSGASAQRMYV